MRLLALLCCLVPSALAAQGWNDTAATALVGRAVLRRVVVQGDSGVRSWHVRAHGLLLFLARRNDPAATAERLIKADELDVEVYWTAPGRSKQVIRGWRDRRYLPTDIRYHRDHLGIVTDGYGPMIRIGEGDEVRNVVHPLSVAGPSFYDYALRDSVQVVAGADHVTLDVIDVRPKDPAGPGVLGTLYLDRGTAELVRARFSFTPASYRDHSVEALTVLLDNARIEGRVWLPWKQTIEIRRNGGWLDLPYSGVIRGTWEFGEYDLDTTIAPTTFIGLPIGGLLQPGDSARPWPAPIDSVLAAAPPAVTEGDVAAARAEVRRAVEGRVGGEVVRPRALAASVSDLIHFDRVQGAALGVGAKVESRESRVVLRPRIGVGTADGRVTGGVDIDLPLGNSRLSTLNFHAERTIRDLSDHPVISRALNSLVAQEAGEDHGDYVLVEGAGVRASGGAGCWVLGAGYEDPSTLGISATSARGTFRPQADLGGPGYWTGNAEVGCRGDGENGWHLALSGGEGRGSWGRGTADMQGELRAGATMLRATGRAGWTSDDAPAWRTFVLGGRGTLLGEKYRDFGGRTMAWGQLEWRLPLPVPAIPLGDFASTGKRATIAPFVQAGWADRQVAGMPWHPTDGTRVSAGVALELFYDLIRIEAGRSFQTGNVGVTFDVAKGWWGVL